MSNSNELNLNNKSLHLEYYDCKLNDMFSFLIEDINADKVNEFINIIKPLMDAENLYKHYKGGVVDGKRGNERYIVLVSFKNSYVNKSLVKGYEDKFENDKYQEFPVWASIDKKMGDNINLYFCLHYEKCSPNWNDESEVIKVIPLTEISMPIINDLQGIKKIEEHIKYCIEYVSSKKSNELPDYGNKPNKEQLAELINKGMKCVYRKGLAYRDAKEIKITKDKALELLPQYSYGKGFYTLSYYVSDNVPTLVFNELSVFDLE